MFGQKIYELGAKRLDVRIESQLHRSSLVVALAHHVGVLAVWMHTEHVPV